MKSFEYSNYFFEETQGEETLRGASVIIKRDGEVVYQDDFETTDPDEFGTRVDEMETGAKLYLTSTKTHSKVDENGNETVVAVEPAIGEGPHEDVPVIRAAVDPDSLTDEQSS